MTKPIFKRSDIQNPAYYREHRAEIVEAMNEPGRPRLVNDVDSREATNSKNTIATTVAEKEAASAANLFQPEAPLQFKRSDIARMSPATYQQHRSAILEAAKRPGGIIDDTKRPELQVSLTIYENESAYIQSGGFRRDKAVGTP